HVQAHQKKHDQRIGGKSQVLTGQAASAILLQNYDPRAFSLRGFLERQGCQERRIPTTDAVPTNLD
ncbi:hypothetical protein BDN70DRAFT_762943, partial [Pholiota conissans]